MNNLTIDIFGHGYPLVMIHGWGWDSNIWDPLLPELTKKYQVFLVNLPGTKQTTVYTENYTFENIIPHLLKNLPENAIWLGWSLGGLFATWTAIYFPERVSHLITVSSSPKFISSTNWPGVEIKVFEKFFELLCDSPQKTLLDFLELQLRGSAKQHELFCELQNKISSFSTSFAALLGGLNLLRETDLRNSLKKIACPNLHIFGQMDTIVPVGVRNYLTELLPHSHLESIRRAGHMPFLSHTEPFLELLNNFLT